MKKCLPLFASALCCLSMTAAPIQTATVRQARHSVRPAASFTRPSGNGLHLSGKIGTAPRSTSQRSLLQQATKVSTFTSTTGSAAPAYAPSILGEMRGVLIYDDAWGSRTDIGVYSVPLNADEGLSKMCGNSHMGAASFYKDGVVYTPNLVVWEGMFIMGATLAAFDAETGSVISEVDIDDNFQYLSATYVPSLDAALACVINLNNDQYSLVQIGLDGVVIKIADLGENEFAAGMTAGPDGTVYGLSTGGTLCTINPSTGDFQVVGQTYTTSNYTSSMTYDERNSLIHYVTCAQGVNPALYSIDPKTAQATRRYSFTRFLEFGLLYMAPLLADEAAPAAVTGLKAEFAPGECAGTVRFTPPSVTYAGNAGSGNITYTVKANGLEVASGTTAFSAGEVSLPLVMDKSGFYKIEVLCSNDHGDGPVASTELFIGKDAPAPVKNVNLSYASETLTLTWAPATAANDGYINQKDVTYTVTRYINGTPTEVSTDMRGTTYVENRRGNSGDLENIYYTVAASYGGVSATPSASNSVNVGYLNPPYEADLSSWNSAMQLTTIDANNDGVTWKYSTEYGPGTYCYSFNPQSAASDYLVLPGLKLEAGKLYFFSFTAGSKTTSYVERIAAYVGTSATPDGLNTEILPETDVTTMLKASVSGLQGEDFELPFIPSQDGVYYFSIKACSPINKFALSVGDIKVSRATAYTAPGPVTDLEAVAAPDGSSKVTLKFKAPRKNLNGLTLKSLSKVEIFRGSELIETLHPAIGETVEYTDEHSVPGNVNYTVTPWNEDGVGTSASASAYVGITTPAPCTNVNAGVGSDFGEVLITWDPVTTDVNGKPISGVTYTVARYVENSWIAQEDGITGTSCAIRVASPYDAQRFEQFAVYPVSDKGIGQGTSIDLVPVGAPYAMPYRESFRLNTIVGVSTLEGAPNWEMVSDNKYEDIQSQDGDNVFLTFVDNVNACRGRIYTGRITVDENAQNPVFVYYFFGANSNAVSEFQLYVDEGDGFKTVGNPYRATRGVFGEWNRVTASMAPYKGKSIRLAIEISSPQATAEAIDNMQLVDMPEHDMAITLSLPESVAVGETLNATAFVKNMGTVLRENYSVDFIVNDSIMATKPGKNLPEGEMTPFYFTYEVNHSAPEKLQIQVHVNCWPDVDWENNYSDKVMVPVARPDFPAVTDLSASGSEGNVELSWNSPDYAAYECARTESFEGYDVFTGMNDVMGEWTIIDRDGGPSGAFSNLDVPGLTLGKPYSFFVMDSSLSDTGESFRANTGTKSLVCLYNADYSQNDDWLISPELNGDAQTISFYARAYDPMYPEKVEILYSTTDKDVNSFKSLKVIDGITTDGDLLTWTRYTADLPEGAKYFAIRFISKDTFLIMIDDISFIPAAESRLTLKGYNVYRDGKKINESLVEAPSFSESGVTGQPGYVVTAVYDAGESHSSNVVYPFGNSVESILSAPLVRGLQGFIEVTAAAEQTVTVADMQGRVIYRGVAGRIPATAGAYVVTAGGHNVKVLVK